MDGNSLNHAASNLSSNNDNLNSKDAPERSNYNTGFERNMGFGEDDDTSSGMNRTFLNSDLDGTQSREGKGGHEAALGKGEVPIGSLQRGKMVLDRTVTAADVINIIDNIQKPQELIQAFESYNPKSNLVNVEEMKRSENTKIKRYKDCVYFGEFINSKRHGKGVMVYCNGRLYEGDWENDAKHGKGMEIMPNGNKYEGQFVNGKPEGIGTFIWRNGEVYEGEWKNGLKHGSGMWRGIKGESYIGEWKYGKADGYGVHTWRNGDRYEGEFKACLKHGHGTEKFANGDFYVGNYVNGKPDGYGEYYWANGCQYKGFFKNGLRHGKGVWRKGSGQSDKYDGEWVNDKKCGYGLYNWASGNYFKGNYFDDLRHGYGEMYWIDGSVYKGNWERGIQHGDGELLIPGKKPKVGLFQNNIFIGENNETEESTRVISHGTPIPMSQPSANVQTSPKSMNPLPNPAVVEEEEDRKKRSSSLRPNSHIRNNIQTPQRFMKPSKINHNFSMAESLSPTKRQNLDVSIQTDVSGHVTNGVYGLSNQGNGTGAYSTLTSEYSKLPSIIGDRGFNTRFPSPMKVTPKNTRDSVRSNGQASKPSYSSDRRSRPPLGTTTESTLMSRGGQGQLTNKELAKWNHLKEKMAYNPDKFKNLDDPEVCERIRAIINPPIWRPWAK